MNNLSMAKSLMGSQRSNPGQTTTSYGIATSDSVSERFDIQSG